MGGLKDHNIVALIFESTPPPVYKVVLFFSIALVVSCNNRYPSPVQTALNQSGPNKAQLVKVINHYSQHLKDSLKLQAANFLIGNMPGHGYRARSDIFVSVFDSAATYQNLEKRKYFFTAQMERLRQQHPTEFRKDSVIADLNHVTAEFLIRNIDLAFKAYNRIPLKYRSSFDHFLEYILPYRVNDEPLEFGNRKKQLAKFGWVHDQLQADYTMREVISSVLDSMKFNLYINHGYPGGLAGSQMEKVAFGQCSDMVNYAANVFRAVGIPATGDFTPHWGNRHDLGHDWLSFPADSLLGINLPGKRKVNLRYKHGSLPKIYRITYSLNSDRSLYTFARDVTAFYKKPNKITIANRWKRNTNGQPVYLFVFDQSNVWEAVGIVREVTNDAFIFEDIAPNVVFLAGYSDKNKELHPLNYPFTIDDEQQINYFDIREVAPIDTATLLRKKPPYVIVWYVEKIEWKQSVRELTLQGSNNPSFRQASDLFRMGNVNSTHVRTFPLSYEGKYRYYRLARPDTNQVWLATLRPHGIRDYKKAQASIRGDTLEMANLEDTDPLSYVGGKELEVWYDFGKPIKLDSLQLQVRNDDNHIRIGDTYELRYWDQGWHSLGRRVARDTALVYRDIPAGALFWLQNHTRGREEHLFTITKNGNQWWPGTSEYPIPLPWMKEAPAEYELNKRE